MSKCQKKLYQLLESRYPLLTFVYNDRKTLLGHEIDIYIPALKIAIEWQGSSHYLPIYGKLALQKTINNDDTKRNKMIELDIRRIYIVDLFSKEKQIQETFSKICSILDLIL